MVLSLFGFLDLAGTQATRANRHTFHFAFGNNPDLLNIGIPAPWSYIMSMADGVSETNAFAADIADLSQFILLS
jgi:hypothetical protein